VPHPGKILVPHPGKILVPHPGKILVPYPGKILVPHPGKILVSHPGKILVPHPGKILVLHPGKILVPHPEKILPTPMIKQQVLSPPSYSDAHVCCKAAEARWLIYSFFRILPANLRQNSHLCTALNGKLLTDIRRLVSSESASSQWARPSTCAGSENHGLLRKEETERSIKHHDDIFTECGSGAVSTDA